MKRPLVLLALLALPAASLGAQTVDFTPRIGAYVPLKNIVEGTDPFTGLLQEQKPETKFTVGGRLGVWFSSALGIEGVVDYNKGGVQTFLNGNRQSPTLGSHLFAASLRPMVRLNSPSGNVALILSAGGGLADRGGVYVNGISPPSTQLTGRTDVAGAAGVGLLVRLTRDVAARIDVDGYTYQAGYFSPGLGSTGEQRQYDLFITFGLTGPFKNYGIPGE
ncbi:MAG TPA: hypothetical protein VFU46_11515 [Gemmatimonadales bacterium]|nr:hypothetical protein [Gemmatimonadales bacterium]